MRWKKERHEVREQRLGTSENKEKRVEGNKRTQRQREKKEKSDLREMREGKTKRKEGE